MRFLLYCNAALSGACLRQLKILGSAKAKFPSPGPLSREYVRPINFGQPASTRLTFQMRKSENC